MEYGEEERKVDNILKLFCETYQTKVERPFPFVEGIFIEDE